MGVNCIFFSSLGGGGGGVSWNFDPRGVRRVGCSCLRMAVSAYAMGLELDPKNKHMKARLAYLVQSGEGKGGDSGGFHGCIFFFVFFC